MKKLVTAAVLAGVSLCAAGAAFAFDFPATPVNPGPAEPLGIPLVDPILSGVGSITGPILNPIVVPILAPGGVAPAAAPAPVIHHHHYHHHHIALHKVVKKHA